MLMPENEETPKNEQETPLEPVIETPPAPPAVQTPVEPPIQTITHVDSSPELDVKLAQKDEEIRRLTDEQRKAKNERHLTQDELQKAQVALAKAVNEREAIIAEQHRVLTETKGQLKDMSQATQTLSEQQTAIASELDAQKAKATKLEVLTEEFPELLRYAKLIPVSTDPDVVRAACQALQDARTQDLEAHRITAITQNGISQLPTAAGRQDVQLSNPEDMRKWLQEAQGNPEEYERRRRTLLAQIDGAVQRAGITS
jgi:myosin heavy subunit